MDSLQKLHKKSFNIITFTGFPVILFFSWLQFTGRTETIFNAWASIVSGLIFLISSVICFRYYKKIGDRGQISKVILFTAIANLLFFLGSITWAFYTFFLGIEIPYPSFADVFYVLMPVVYALSIIAFFKIYQSSTKISTGIISILIFLGLGYLIFSTVGAPDISSELSFWNNFFNFAYSISDSMYVGAGVALLFIAGGKIYKGIFVWVLAMFLITLADLLFIYRGALGIIWNGDISDQLYTLSAIIFTYSVILLAKISEKNKLEI
jgi:hypothetical protein